jgi:hypothetical protein
MASNILAEQRRDACARQLARDAATWPVVTLTKAHGAFPAGTVFYGVPSSGPRDPITGEIKRYMANDRACNCQDYLKAGNVCKHVRAARIWEQRQAETLGLATDGEVDAAIVDMLATRPNGGRSVVANQASRPAQRRYEDLFPADD